MSGYIMLANGYCAMSHALLLINDARTSHELMMHGLEKYVKVDSSHFTIWKFYGRL